MRRITYVAAGLLAAVAVLPAQTVDTRKIELRPFVGASIPTGDQRDLYGEEPLIGLQAALELRPTLHVVGAFGWVPATAKFMTTDDKVNVFQYDVGLELGLVRPMPGAWEFRPFVGLGAGARTYLFAADQLNDKTCLAGYGALGSEFQLGRTAFRFEARDNVFCYRSPIVGVESKTRNDVSLALGIAYHFR